MHTSFKRTWRLAAAFICSLALGAHAAAPGSDGATSAFAAGPPVLSSFRINNGSASTADPTLNLSWPASGPPAAHWRVSSTSTFPNAPWNPVPAALPFKYLLDSPTDGIKTLHLQLMNDHGQSSVRSAQLEFLAPPNITAIQAVPKGNVALPSLTQVTKQAWPLDPPALGYTCSHARASR